MYQVKTDKKASWTHTSSPTGSPPFWIDRRRNGHLQALYFEVLLLGNSSKRLQICTVPSKDLWHEKLSKWWVFVEACGRDRGNNFDPSPQFRHLTSSSQNFIILWPFGTKFLVLHKWPALNTSTCPYRPNFDASPCLATKQEVVITCCTFKYSS